MKRLILIILISIIGLPALCDAHTIVTYTIDPTKNASEHNNLGIQYVEEKCYYAAIQEFKMAISLNPKTQATATYFNNLGKVYMIIGYPELALDCYKNALKQYNLNFEFYQNLVACYKELGQSSTQLRIYKNKNIDKNPLDKVMLGLLYAQNGDIRKAIIVLDEFVSSEPDLLISNSIKVYIQKLVNEII